MKFFSLFFLLAVGASAKLATPVTRELRMMKNKKNGNGSSSSKGKGKGKSVDLVDTEAEIIALVYSGACEASPESFSNICAMQGGYTVVIDNGVEAASYCCDTEFFDIQAIAALLVDDSIPFTVGLRRKLKELSEEEKRKLAPACVTQVEVVEIVGITRNGGFMGYGPPFPLCVAGTLSSPSIGIIAGGILWCFQGVDECPIYINGAN